MQGHMIENGEVIKVLLTNGHEIATDPLGLNSLRKKVPHMIADVRELRFIPVGWIEMCYEDLVDGTRADSKRMDLATFRATGRNAILTPDITGRDAPCIGRIYLNHFYIEHLGFDTQGGGVYRLALANDEYESTKLRYLEEKLFDYARSEGMA